MVDRQEANAVVIGGGFFGVEIAAMLADRLGGGVVLLEKELGLLQRASYNNQARIHGGYHYPRSVLTAWRSRVNHPRFLRDYAAAVMPGFQGYFAVGRQQSHVTAEQFRRFMERVGAPLAPAPAPIRDLFNADLVEDVWTATDESVFDAVKLKTLIAAKLVGRATVRLGAAATAVRADGDRLILAYRDAAGDHEIATRHVFNVTYSRLNCLLRDSGLPLIPLKQELTEMPLVSVPPEFGNLGVTMMCGPFFSLMPFPDKGSHTLSHVRYTPHHEWPDDATNHVEPHAHLERYQGRSHVQEMLHDASRFLPRLAACRPTDDSIWEVKTILPISETDDSRPILFRANWGLRGLHCILGGKIDNIYDILAELENLPL